MHFYKLILVVSDMFLSFITIVGVFGGESELSVPVDVHSVAITLIDDFEVGFEEAGRISQVEVSEGSEVSQGEMIAVQSDVAAKLEVERMRAQVEIARADAANDLDVLLQSKILGLAEDELNRALESVKQFPQSVSKTEIKRLQFAVEEARIQIRQAEFLRKKKQLELQLKESELQIAQEKLSRRELRSPIDGQVVEVLRRGGEWIQPTEALMRIIRTDRLRAEGFVDEFSRKVDAGQIVHVSVRDSSGETTSYEGVVTFVDPKINPITGQYRVIAEISNPDRTLRPGQQSTMQILSPEKNRANIGSKAPMPDKKAVNRITENRE